MKNQTNKNELPQVQFDNSPKKQLVHSLLKLQATEKCGFTVENGWSYNPYDNKFYKAIAQDKDNGDTIYLKVSCSLDSDVNEYDLASQEKFELPNILNED